MNKKSETDIQQLQEEIRKIKSEYELAIDQHNQHEKKLIKRSTIAYISSGIALVLAIIELVALLIK